MVSRDKKSGKNTVNEVPFSSPDDVVVNNPVHVAQTLASRSKPAITPNASAPTDLPKPTPPKTKADYSSDAAHLAARLMALKAELMLSRNVIGVRVSDDVKDEFSSMLVKASHQLNALAAQKGKVSGDALGKLIAHHLLALQEELELLVDNPQEIASVMKALITEMHVVAPSIKPYLPVAPAPVPEPIVIKDYSHERDSMVNTLNDFCISMDGSKAKAIQGVMDDLDMLGKEGNPVLRKDIDAIIDTLPLPLMLAMLEKRAPDIAALVTPPEALPVASPVSPAPAEPRRRRVLLVAPAASDYLASCAAHSPPSLDHILPERLAKMEKELLVIINTHRKPRSQAMVVVNAVAGYLAASKACGKSPAIPAENLHRLLDNSRIRLNPTAEFLLGQPDKEKIQQLVDRLNVACVVNLASEREMPVAIKKLHSQLQGALMEISALESAEGEAPAVDAVFEKVQAALGECWDNTPADGTEFRQLCVALGASRPDLVKQILQNYANDDSHDDAASMRSGPD